MSSNQSTRRLILAAPILLLIALPSVCADERRAPAPKFTDADTRNVFFDKLSDAFRDGNRPSLASIRKASNAPVVTPDDPQKPGGDPGSKGGDKWTKLISPESLEEEVKGVRLAFNDVVTTPAAFNGGGYQDARLHLSVLATVFAVINEYGGEVRWKEQAAAARDLLARTAFNCKAGSTQVYNEAKLRKADLDDLVQGGGLSKRNAEPQTDWSMIVDRSPMMEYGEIVSDELKSITNNEGSIKSNSDQVRRQAEMLAVLGEVFIQEGMDQWDEEDYVLLSKKLTQEATGVAEALKRGDYDAVSKGAGAIKQACDACHEQYR